MFPPVDEEVLRNNPGFANLYKTLTTTVLNPDGSSRHDAEARARGDVQKQLAEHRLREAKHRLLQHAIATATPCETKPTSATRLPRAGDRAQSKVTAASSQPDLPESLLDLLLVLPPFLEAAHSLPPESRALLLSNPPLSEFEDLLPDLASLISSNLHTTALSLARLSHPSTNPSYLHRHISSLPQHYASLSASLSTAKASLATARLRTLASLTEFLQLYSQCLAYLVHSLEAKHGVVARSLELRASDVSFQAQRGEMQAEQTMWNMHRQLYPPQVVMALQNYAAHLKDARIRGVERLKGLEAELGEYGVGVEGGGAEEKEKTLREIAKVYRQMSEQMEDVLKDLERLQDK